MAEGYLGGMGRACRCLRTCYGRAHHRVSKEKVVQIEAALFRSVLIGLAHLKIEYNILFRRSSPARLSSACPWARVASPRWGRRVSRTSGESAESWVAMINGCSRKTSSPAAMARVDTYVRPSPGSVTIRSGAARCSTASKKDMLEVM